VKIRTRTFRAQLLFPASVAEGAAAPIKLALPKAARGALRAAGAGRVTLAAAASSSNGQAVSWRAALRLLPKR
jgi:hypothetical protein